MTEKCIFPATARAGVTFEAALVVALHPAPDWTLKAIVRGVNAFDLTAVGNGSTHTFSADVATTSDWAAGLNWVSIRAYGPDGDVRELSYTEFKTLPDTAQLLAGYDGRSANEVALEAIEAVLAKRASRDQERYTINNRELWRTPIADLIKLKAFYTSAVRREKNKQNGNGTFGRAVAVRFK